jgi:hypothetical protein
MSGFENYEQQGLGIEREIIRNGIALGVDWDDPVEVRLLAQEALACNPSKLDFIQGDQQQRTRYELFGLIHLMLQVMTESAGEGVETHGGSVWKTLARALWAERDGSPVEQPGR